MTAGRSAIIVLGSLILYAPQSYAQQVDTGRVYTVEQADIAPVLLRQPRDTYSDSLRHAGVGGVVTLQAILDTTGRPESASVHVVKTPDGALAAPARALVLGSRFTPAFARGRRGRYLLELSLEFDPQDTTPPPPPVYTNTDSLEQQPMFLRWRPGWRPLTAWDSVQLSRLSSRQVVLMMIIDSLGHPDTASVQVIEPPHSLLALTVARYVPLMEFSPGRRHGRPVRALVKLPLNFR